jgi:nitric-oxide synthase, bacterial
VSCPVRHGVSLAEPDRTEPEETAPPVDHAAAETFIRLFHAEVLGTDPDDRLRAVHAELHRTGDYVHTQAELQWASRVAWRNADRCVGRAYWQGLRVRDRRHVDDPRQVAAETAEHARQSFNGGHIRPTMTVFAPAAPGTTGPRIANEQLIRYAGDPRYHALRDLATGLGWDWDGDQWAVLPLVVRSDRAGPVVAPVPADAVVEVQLEHPWFRWFADLGLRWHALPIITDMRLEAGGKWYLVPFGGWYVETEISARNLADPDRLDMLPQIATRLGLDRSQVWTDWRNAATVALNQAVLWSFARDGIRISHHHVEAERLLEHLAREGRAGRAWQENVDWSWVNLPSATPTPTFHRYYRHQPDLPLPRLVRFRSRCPAPTPGADPQPPPYPPSPRRRT